MYKKNIITHINVFEKSIIAQTGYYSAQYLVNCDNHKQNFISYVLICLCLKS